jgi:hypothetical protein
LWRGKQARIRGTFAVQFIDSVSRILNEKLSSLTAVYQDEDGCPC